MERGLEATLAALAAALQVASAGGDISTIGTIAGAIAKATDELRARRLEAAGNVVALDRKRGAK